ncbi:MAG: tetratricopeptide repeat protein [Chloroflexi bacterium]|nr:tetratricopeptide repeat protein [Chloroflexota bacterium]
MINESTFPHITTKLHVPTTRSDLLNRPRLNQQLDRCVEHKLMLVSAPTGFGKTTLLSEWSQQSECPVAWVSLDDTDNDPMHFWSYVVAALDKLDDSVGENVLPLIHSSRPSPVEYTIPTLINTVTSIPAHFTLVLDDYHCIESETIHEALAYLLEYLPSNMHVILLSRTEPPLPLAQWRARGQLMELRVPDLRFLMDETAHLFNQTMGLDLLPRDVATLQERTEGWAAGLQLAALTVQDQSGVGSLQDFSGDHQYIAGYLASEVLQRQPEPVRDFLLQTSVLKVLKGSLCDAVTGGTDSAVILEQLHQANLFIAALDRKGHYRYHQMFADFLRDQLERDPSFDPSVLHLRAADWYERHGGLNQAIDHTLAAGHVDEAVHLIEKTARQHVMRGEFATLLGWFRTLPDHAIHERPEFCLLYAWVLTNSGQQDAASAMLDQLDAHLHDSDEANTLLGEAANVRARIAVFRGDTAQNIHYSKKSLDLLPADHLMRGDVFLDLAFAHNDVQDFEAAEPAFIKAIELSQPAGNLRTALMATYYLSDTYVNRGLFRQAVQRWQQGVAWCKQADPPSASACWAHAGFGALLYEWNDVASAVDHLRKALDLGRKSGEIKVLMYAPVSLASALQTQGQPDEALTLLDAGAEVARQTSVESLAQNIDAARMAVWLRQGELDTAERWLQHRGLSVWSNDLPHSYVTMLARFHLAQSRADQASSTDELARAIELLETLYDVDTVYGLTYVRAQHLALLAMLYLAFDDDDQAIDKLAKAVSLAEPLGLVRTFVDYGVGMASLLRDLATKGHGPNYLAKLLGAFRDDASPQREIDSLPPVISQPLIDPLRRREIEVLEHINQGCSNKEIADEMVVAVSTVKWYLRNIYGKLQVNRRTQAVARARELNLL